MRATLICIVFCATAVGAAFAVASCSSSSPKSGGGDGGDDAPAPTFTCLKYTSTVDLTTPTISFSKDVMPIFEHSCGLSSSCHNDPTVIGTLGIFLGCDTATSMSCAVANPGPQVYADLVGSPDAGEAGAPLVPLEIKSMPYVTAGGPSNNYIMHKLHNDQCTVTHRLADNA